LSVDLTRHSRTILEKDSFMFIAVEGCVGAGKSTVASGLAQYRRSKILLEKFEENPFLPAFYENPSAFAIETEFMFLLLHFHQLKQQLTNIANDELVSDFHFGKDLLYAELNFDDVRTLKMFKSFYDFLNEQLPAPNLLIGLSATTELLMERIRKRDRRIELQITPDYYDRVNSIYRNFFESYPGKKLIISMDEWDFVERPALYSELSGMVDAELQELVRRAQH
jgi:deoxyadenosine/deoxycytidine kinase